MNNDWLNRKKLRQQEQWRKNIEEARLLEAKWGKLGLLKGLDMLKVDRLVSDYNKKQKSP